MTGISPEQTLSNHPWFCNTERSITCAHAPALRIMLTAKWLTELNIFS
ncbi:hypothetical protein EPYR_01918 [Erwinia pyrifoliae DSM 12163]|nr:hypothetical protein EPYR_01918 [Erwinia pyrifoliae DSM 12163]